MNYAQHEKGYTTPDTIHRYVEQQTPDFIRKAGENASDAWARGCMAGIIASLMSGWLTVDELNERIKASEQAQQAVEAVEKEKGAA